MNNYEIGDIPLHPAVWMREMVQQLELTERATPAQQTTNQKNHLRELVKHAINTVPAYKKRLKPLVQANGDITLDAWHDVPVLMRDDAVDLGDELVSSHVPANHGAIINQATSGSTRIPFVFKTTQFHYTMWSCITARYHRWHNIDYRRSFAAIRPLSLGTASWPEGRHRKSWAAPALEPDQPGPFHGLNINTSIERQIEWLRRVKPEYLHSFTSNARALALGIEEEGQPFKLRRLLTYAEMLTPETRHILSRVFGSNPCDCYSSRECGYLALQSPVSDNWLVQSEVTLLEILDDQDQPCKPGEMGRVIVTALHNYAQPLIRYDLGDLATFGTEDISGLPFPILSKIHGRTRNLFRFSGGKLIQPDFKTENINRFLNPRKWQVAQIGESALEFRIVPGIEPSQMDTKGMDQYIRDLLGMDLTIQYKLVTELTDPHTGKCEDYICELEDN